MRRLLLAGTACLALISRAYSAEPPAAPASSWWTWNTHSAESTPLDSHVTKAEAIEHRTASLPPSPAALATAKPTASPFDRKHIEAALQSPAQLDFDNRDTVTVKELLDQIHERHGLSIRFDMPTLGAMFGASAMQHDSPVVAGYAQPMSAGITNKRGGTVGKLIGVALGQKPAPACCMTCQSNETVANLSPLPPQTAVTVSDAEKPSACDSSAETSPVLQWEHDLSTAESTAAQSNRHVLVHFWAPWCGPCRRLDENVFSHQDVQQELERQFVPVKINVDDFPATVHNTFKIERVPTDVVLNSDGKIICTLSCPQSPAEYVAQLNHALDLKPQAAEATVAATAPPVLPPPPPPSSAMPSAAIAARAQKAPPAMACPAGPTYSAAPACPVTSQYSAYSAAPATPSAISPSAAPPAPPSPAPLVAPGSESDCQAVEAKPADEPRDVVAELLKTPVNVGTLDLHNMTVATVLRHALESLPTGGDSEDASGLPIALTTAATFDYVVENDGLLVTSRLKALTYKETRVYSVKNLKHFQAEQLAVVIRQAVRPWSWRSRIDDLGEKLRVGGPRIPPKAIEALLKSGVQLTGGVSMEPTLTAMPAEPPPPPGATPPVPASVAAPAPTTTPGAAAVPLPAVVAHPADSDSLTPQDAALLGDAIVNGLVTFVHTSLTAVEIMHYADPPTGSIQTLPGKLIITQSQAAHREIEELLKQLAEE